MKTWIDIARLLLRWPYSGLVGFLFGLFVANRVLYADFCKGAFQDEATITGGKRAVDSLVCGSSTRDLVLGDAERKIMWILSIIGVFGNVIPKYIKNDGAKRHIAQVKGNHIMLVHIVSGILTVLGNGLAGILLGSSLSKDSKVFVFLISADLGHQLSIVLLLKNHDGIYPLRCGNLTLSVVKFTTLINQSHHASALTISDILFTNSFGFMGTRLASLLSYLAMAGLGYKNGIKYEHWYAMGVSLAQFHVMMRVPGSEVVYLLLMPLASVLFYHELWNKAFKPLFVGLNLVYSLAVLTLTTSSTERRFVGLAAWYMGAGFWQPRFHRWPENALQHSGKQHSFKFEHQRKIDLFD